MNTPFSKLSVIAILLLGLYALNPLNACAVNPAAAQLTQVAEQDSLSAPRQFTLAQPGSPYGIVSKQLRSFEHTPLQSTGYRVKKGEV